MSRARELAGFATATNPIQDLNVGVVTAISFSGDGSSLTGIDATSIKDGDGTVRAQANTSGVVVTGIITATSLEGDGSALTGLPAGLGTAVSATGDGANVYYTNQVLDLASNLSIDVPATAVVAYTQYPEVAVASGIDLTIADGDDFVADILGIGTTGAPQTLAGGGGRMRADNFTDRGGYNAPTFPNGVSVTGVVTATSSVQVSSGGTFGSNGASAAVYYGDGSNLTGLPALTGSTNNTIVTVTGANALAGESQLTYDGTILQLRKNGAGEYNEIICDGNPSSDRGSLGLISGYWDGDRVADIILSAGDDTSNKNNGIIQFRTAQEGGGNITQRLQIGSQGQLGLNPNNTVGVAATDYGSDGQVLTSKGGSASPQWADAAGGIATEYDAIWLGGDDTYLSADRWGNNHLGQGGSRGTLTRVTNLTPVGDGLTISSSGTSGYITFPSTGLWKIDWHLQVKRDTSGNFEIEMKVYSSTDSGGSFAAITPQSVFPMDVPSGQQTLANHVSFYNVTDASTQRIFLAMYNSLGYDFHTSKNTMIEFSKIA